MVKSNGPADRARMLFIRGESGLLEPVTSKFAEVGLTQAELCQMLVDNIKTEAERGQPFTKTGTNGLVSDQRYRLYPELQELGRNRLDELTEHLLENGLIVKCIANGGGKSQKWLDVPNGPFAMGTGEIVAGGSE